MLVQSSLTCHCSFPTSSKGSKVLQRLALRLMLWRGALHGLNLVLIPRRPGRRPTCDVVAGWNWQRWAICSTGSPGHLRWTADVLNLVRNTNRIGALFNHSTFNMDRIVLLEYVASADDVHIKHFRRRQPPACLRSWTQLNFEGKMAVNA